MKRLSNGLPSESYTTPGTYLRWLPLILAGSISCSTTRPRTDPQPPVLPKNPPAISKLQQWVADGSDQAFRSVLKRLSAPDTGTAPQSLRQFLSKIQVRGGEFSQGFEHDGRRASLIWSLGDVRLPGEAADIEEQVQELLMDLGFRVKKTFLDQRSGLRGRRKLAGATENAFISTPAECTEGSSPACEVEIDWEVQEKARSVVTDLSDLMAALPIVRCRGLDSEYRRLQTQQTVRMTLAEGNADRCQWTATFRATPPNLKAGKLLFMQLAQFLRRRGYVVDEQDEQHKRYYLERTDTLAYLQFPDSSGRVTIRLEPKPLP